MFEFFRDLVEEEGPCKVSSKKNNTRKKNQKNTSLYLKRNIGRTIAVILCVIMVVSSACVVFAEKTEQAANTDTTKQSTDITKQSQTQGAIEPLEERNENTVVVGYPLLKSFNEINSEGYHSGYNYEFLLEMSKYEDLEYKFVMDTWADCIQMLEDGTVDVMGFITKSDEREEFLYYPKLAAGTVNLLVAARENDKTFGYKNYEAMQGKTLGVVRGAGLEKQLDEFLEGQGIEVKKVYFKTERQLKIALIEGDIDLAMGTNFSDGTNTQIVADVCSVPFYFAVSKNSPNGEEIFKKINRATNSIMTFNDSYDEELFDVYGQNNYKKLIYYTEEENAYIEEHPVLKIAFDNSWKPLLYKDDETGEIKGAISEITKLLEMDSGIRFEFIEAENYTEALRMVQSGEADIVSNFVRDLSWADKFKLKLTAAYISLPLEKVVNEKTESKWIVLPKNYMSYAKTSQFAEKDYSIQYYDTVEECYNAVLSGDAKYTYSTSYINNYMMDKQEYSHLDVVPLRSQTVELCMGVKQDAPKAMVSILEKGFMNITEEDINKIVLQSVLEAEDNSLKQWMYENPNAVNGITIAISIAVMVIVLGYVSMRWKNEKILHYNKVTGIWNYAKFEVEAGYALKNAPDKPFVIVHVNISKFRFFNDTYGYEAGNQVLAIVAKTIEKNTSEEEHFASLWADHFVCLLICPDEETLLKRTENLQDELQREILKLYDYRIILKCGAYFVTKEDIEQGKDINAMLQYANHTLAFSQESYKTSIAFFDNNMSSEVENLREVEQDMMRAFYEREFIPYFQPKYNINTGEMIGAEALVRWIHPTKGIIPPGKFLPYFEKTGFITEVDFYIFEESCKYLRKWLDMGKKPIVISSNFSQLHLQNADFVKNVHDIAKRYNLPFELLEFELTETLNVQEMSVATKRVFDLKKLGFLVSIDDFGSGYSSLSVLQELKVDTIKLDRSFLKDGAPNEREYKVMAAIIKLAEDLHMNVICEGVETADQVEILRKVHCECAQGYYYAKPMPPEELESILLT